MHYYTLGLDFLSLGAIEQLTGGSSCLTTKGPSQDASRHLFRPGFLLYTVSPTLKLATSADSVDTRLDRDLEEREDFTWCV